MIALVNGVNYSSANITVVIPVIGAVIGITKIQYNKEQQIDDNYGLGQDPVSRGYGKNTYTGSLSLYKDVWNRIIDLSPAKDPLNLPPFEITVVFSGANGGYRKESLHMCNFKANPMAANEGDTKLVIDIPLAIGGIDYV